MVTKLFKVNKIKKNIFQFSNRFFKNGHLFLSNSEKWILKFLKKVKN